MRDDMLEFAGRINLIQRNLEMMAVSLESATELLKMVMTEVRLAPPTPPQTGPWPPPSWQKEIGARQVEAANPARLSEWQQGEMEYQEQERLQRPQKVPLALSVGHLAMEMARLNPDRPFSRKELEQYLKGRGLVYTAGQITVATGNLISRGRLVSKGRNIYQLSPNAVTNNLRPGRPKKAVPAAPAALEEPTHSGRMGRSAISKEERARISATQKAKYAALSPAEKQARNEKLKAGKRKARLKRAREARRAAEQAVA